MIEQELRHAERLALQVARHVEDEAAFLASRFDLDDAQAAVLRMEVRESLNLVRARPRHDSLRSV